MKFFAPTKISENIQETPEGFLVCLNVPIARTGWQTYGAGEVPIQADSSGKIQIYRDAKEVFSSDTMASFEGKSLTIEHPMDFVNPLNWADLAKGTIVNVRRSPDKDEDGEESLVADILVTDVIAIQLIKSGLREVSCGYEAIYTQTHEGQGVQTKIIGNHLALVKEGRAGPNYAIHDHKIERLSGMSKLADKLKKMFSTQLDEAVAEFEKTSKTADEMGKEKEKKDDKKTDDQEEQKKDGAVSFDELCAMVKDLGEKVSGLMASKDAPEDKSGEKMEGDKANESEKDKPPVKDEDVAPGLEDRLKKVEALLAQLMEGESVGDADGEEKEVGDKEKKDSATGDAAKRVTGLEKTKNAKSFDNGMNSKTAMMTAEKMNEINKAHYQSLNK